MILFEILRLDEYQCAKQQTIDLLSTSTNHITDPDFFEYETHIMFDDAMEWSENGDRTVNKFVTEFLETLEKTTAFLYSVSEGTGEFSSNIIHIIVCLVTCMSKCLSVLHHNSIKRYSTLYAAALHYYYVMQVKIMLVYMTVLQYWAMQKSWKYNKYRKNEFSTLLI